MTAEPINPATREALKALLGEGKQLLEDDKLPEQIALFVSGFLSGLAVCVRVLDGDTAEQALDFFENQLNAMVGKAFLEGKLTTADIATTVAGRP